MSVTQEQIKKIAEKLSKIPWENEKLAWNIQDILKYMELLDEIDTTGVVGTVSVIEEKKAIREDVEKEKQITWEDLLSCSNQKVVGNQIILPNIMK